MVPKKKEVELEIEALVVERGTFPVAVLGTSPLVFNRQSEKVKQGLLLPSRKSRVEKDSVLKHDVYEEFFNSPYTLKDPLAPTLLAIKAAAFKGAIASAALDLSGPAKAQVGRLVQVPGEFIPVYGIPKLFMTTVIQAGVTRAPDIRTRACVPEWACLFEVQYVKPIFTEKAVAHLAAAAGIFVGVGDGRPGKGKLTFGQFDLVSPENPKFLSILKSGGREEQENAMKSPAMYDKESADLYSWFLEEVERRGRSKQLSRKE